jgi:hypothetical protein
VPDDDDDPTTADPVPAPPIEQNPSTTGVVVDEDELDDG